MSDGAETKIELPGTNIPADPTAAKANPDSATTSATGSPLQATLTGVSPGNPAVNAPNASPQDIANASLTDLKSQENKLKDLITAMPAGELKAALEARFNEEFNIKRQSSINALDSRSEATLPDSNNSKNLKEYQDKTKQLFTQKLKNQPGGEEILAQQAEVHKTSLNLLTQALQNEDAEKMEEACTALEALLAPLGQISARAPGMSAQSRFLAALEGKDPPSLTNPNNGKYVQVTGNTITSNDPEVLGLALAAAGYKTVTLTGEPFKVIEAAKVALAAGVETIKFDKTTLKELYNPRVYNSFAEYEQAMRELQAIDNIMKAKQAVRNGTKTNNPFVDQKKSELTNIFNRISPNVSGHQQMMERMTLDQKARLAAETKDQEFIKDKKVYTGSQYVRSLIPDSQRKAFDVQYAKEIVNNGLPELKAITTPKEAAQFIANQDAPVRKEYYTKINELGEHLADDNTKQTFRNDLRAEAIASTIDRQLTLEAKQGAPGWLLGTKDRTKDEVAAIIAGETDAAQKNDIKGKYLEYIQTAPSPENNKRFMELWQGTESVFNASTSNVQNDTGNQSQSAEAAEDQPPPLEPDEPSLEISNVPPNSAADNLLNAAEEGSAAADADHPPPVPPRAMTLEGTIPAAASNGNPITNNTTIPEGSSLASSTDDEQNAPKPS